MTTKLVLQKSRTWHSFFIYGNLSERALEAIDAECSYEKKDKEFIDKEMLDCLKCGKSMGYKKNPTMICPKCGVRMTIRLWDGIFRLLRQFRNGTWHFPAGLLPRVYRVLTQLDYDVEVRAFPASGCKIRNLTWKGHKLRDYQVDQVLRVMDKFDTGEGCIVAMPTASGKSLTAMWIIKTLRVPTLILVNSKVLLHQWVEVLKETLDLETSEIGIYNNKERNIGVITIAMVQTLSRHLNNFPLGYFDFVLSDESHHAAADQTYNILMRCPAKYRLGLSATPFREQGDELRFIAVLGEVLETVTTPELIEDGKLATPEVHFYEAPAVKTDQYNWHKAYREGIVDNEKRNALIVQIARELVGKGKKVYIHVTDLDHGKYLNYLMPESVFLHGTDSGDVRKRVLKAFENGKLEILISTLLSEGFDMPTLDAIILASGGKSKVALIQKVGRVLRISSGKDRAIIVDFIDSGKWLRDHSQIRRYTIEKLFGEQEGG